MIIDLQDPEEIINLGAAVNLTIAQPMEYWLK